MSSRDAAVALGMITRLGERVEAFQSRTTQFRNCRDLQMVSQVDPSCPTEGDLAAQERVLSIHKRLKEEWGSIQGEAEACRTALLETTSVGQAGRSEGLEAAGQAELLTNRALIAASDAVLGAMHSQ